MIPHRLTGSVFLLVVSVLGPAWAGPNAGGILVAHNPALWESATDGAVSVCDQGSAPATYGGIWARVNGATGTNPAIWKVYCVFPSAGSPRLAGLTLGLSYDENKITLPRWGSCVDFELPGPAWPASGTGSSLLWDIPATGTITQAYWFTGYADSPSTVDLGPNPTQGGTFADDGNPAELDPIAGYGKMGFDMDGSVPPIGGGPGACCDLQSGVCSVATAEECGANIFKGTGTSCTPDPCTALGACCDPINFLCLQASRVECDARSGAFLGVETTCTVEGAVMCFIAGACCTACGCDITLQNACPSPGIWKGTGTSCSPNPCTPMAAVCCDETNGACTLEAQSACTGAEVWRCQWLSCAPNPCPQFGACCSPVTGVCTFSLQDDCGAPGLWHPEWAACSPNPCPPLRACCDLWDLCTLALETNCGTPGIWHPDWTACAPGLCPPSAVAPPDSPGKGGFLGAVPNPFLSSTRVWFRLGYSGPALCEVSTASGRMVRRIPGTVRAGESCSVLWDGRSDTGRDLPTGVYWIRLITPGGTAAGRAVLIR